MKINIKHFFLFYVLTSTVIANVSFIIDYSQPAKPFKHFWRSTGFDPASLALAPHGRQNIIYIGSSPRRGTEFVRPHYLLDLVEIISIDKTNVYNWSRLDTFLDLLITNKLRPIFELMGTPTNYFDTNNTFEDIQKLTEWRKFIKDLTEHILVRYGKKEVVEWYFEVWNEVVFFWNYSSDGSYSNKINSFINYWDASSLGLKNADSDLRLGGLGEWPHHIISTAPVSEVWPKWLRHIETGTNIFKGENIVKPDFISVHLKALPVNMISNELIHFDYIKKNHSTLTNLPWINDEADVRVGWSKEKNWQATSWISSFIAKSIACHSKLMVDNEGIDYEISSHDNGFVGNFKQRTHTALFTNENGFALIKKTSHEVMTMLSMLGKQRLSLTNIDTSSPIGLIATKSETNFYAILIYNMPIIDPNDEFETGYRNVSTVNVSLTKLSFTNATLVNYRLDKNNVNPYDKWKDMGSPNFLSSNELQTLRTQMELSLFDEPTNIIIESGEFELEYAMSGGSVHLVMLLQKPPNCPAPIQNIRTETFYGLYGQETMILWDSLNSKFIQSYDVYSSQSGNKLNLTDLTGSSFIYPNNNSNTTYEVIAVDYWGRESSPEPSLITTVLIFLFVTSKRYFNCEQK